MTKRSTDSERDQLERYAKDLQRLSRLERSASSRVDSMVAQLETYAADVRRAVGRERTRTRELEEAYRGSLVRLARAIDLRDRETGEHAERLADYADILCDALRIPADEKTLICQAAPLHDVGKVAVPDCILLKPGPLDDAELEVMRSHCGMGASLLTGTASPWLHTAREAALTHHECWDGSGYPRGLTGEEIPLCGRVVKLVDCYDIARSTRPHKASTGPDAARRALLDGDQHMRPEHFDPNLLDIFAGAHAAFDEIFRVRGGR